MSHPYPNVSLFIAGEWRPALSGKTIDVLNPATEEPIGTVAHAEKDDLDLALAAAQKGFAAWRAISAFDRSKVMRRAADLLRGGVGFDGEERGDHRSAYLVRMLRVLESI